MAARGQRNSLHGAEGQADRADRPLIADKKLPILEDVRDESDEQIRIVLVPKSRNVDPDLLKEIALPLTDLETGSASTSTCWMRGARRACWG
jgi:hypothetical protein